MVATDSDDTTELVESAKGAPMTDNTELDKLDLILANFAREKTYPEVIKQYANYKEAKAAIEAWKDAACREARIDELEGLLKTTYMHIFNELVVEVALVEKRLKLLNTQEETHE